jgi:hypothetical protein
MTAFPFPEPDNHHFRFNVGLVYLGSVEPFSGKPWIYDSAMEYIEI